MNRGIRTIVVKTTIIYEIWLGFNKKIRMNAFMRIS